MCPSLYLKAVVDAVGLRNEDGVTAIEYGLIAALIAVVCIAAFTFVGGSLSSTFNYIGTQV